MSILVIGATGKTGARVAAHLTALGIKYERLPAGLDTGNVPPQLMQAINKLPPTEPFVIPSQGFITVNVITARKPVASDPMEARAAAVRAWRRKVSRAIGRWSGCRCSAMSTP